MKNGMKHKFKMPFATSSSMIAHSNSVTLCLPTVLGLKELALQGLVLMYEVSL